MNDPELRRMRIICATLWVAIAFGSILLLMTQAGFVTFPSREEVAQREIQDRPDSHDINYWNLRSQEGMWAAAVGLLLLTLAQSAISAAGLIWLYRTFKATNRTALAAESAQRAHLHVAARINFEDRQTTYSDEWEHRHRMRFDIRLTNYGHTPATEVEFAFVLHVYSTEGMIDNDSFGFRDLDYLGYRHASPHTPNKCIHKVNQIVGPNGDGVSISIEDQDTVEILHNSSIILGMWTYRDVFGKKYTVRTRIDIDFQSAGDRRSGMLMGGIDERILPCITDELKVGQKEWMN